MPVSWQIAPSVSAARSMFCAMIVRACADRVFAGSPASEVFIAARTSGGRSVDVRTISWRTESKKEASIRGQYTGWVHVCWMLGAWVLGAWVLLLGAGDH